MAFGQTKLIGLRLREAREARALSQVALADLLGVSKSSVCQYEGGHQSPSPEIVARICERLNLPSRFFTEARPVRERSPLLWRALSAANKSVRSSHEQRYLWFRDVVDVLGEYVEFPRPNFPDFDVPTNPTELSDDDIEELAAQTRRHWGLGDGPISNLVWLLENNGGVVVRGEMGDAMRDAYSDWDADNSGRCFVFLGTDKGSAVRSRFDLAHELGHVILHRNVPKAVRHQRLFHRVMEKQAHRFAGAFMLPRKSFPDELYAFSIQSLLQIKPRWRISIRAMIMRLLHLHVIDDDRRRQLLIYMSRKKWNKLEPLDETLQAEEPMLLKRSLDLLLENRVLSSEELSRRVMLWPADIEKLLGVAPGYLAEPAPAIKLQLAM